MAEPKTNLGISPIKIGKTTIRPLRLTRSIVGFGLIAHAFLWTARNLGTTAMAMEVGVALLMIDPTLLTDAMSAWKSRNGS